MASASGRRATAPHCAPPPTTTSIASVFAAAAYDCSFPAWRSGHVQALGGQLAWLWSRALARPWMNCGGMNISGWAFASNTRPSRLHPRGKSVFHGIQRSSAANSSLPWGSEQACIRTSFFSQRRRTKQRTMVSEGIVGSIVGTATWPLFLLILFTCSRWGVGGVQLSHVKLGCRYCGKPWILSPLSQQLALDRLGDPSF